MLARIVAPVDQRRAGFGLLTQALREVLEGLELGTVFIDEGLLVFEDLLSALFLSREIVSRPRDAFLAPFAPRLLVVGLLENRRAHV